MWLVCSFHTCEGVDVGRRVPDKEVEVGVRCNGRVIEVRAGPAGVKVLFYRRSGSRGANLQQAQAGSSPDVTGGSASVVPGNPQVPLLPEGGREAIIPGVDRGRNPWARLLCIRRR